MKISQKQFDIDSLEFISSEMPINMRNGIFSAKKNIQNNSIIKYYAEPEKVTIDIQAFKDFLKKENLGGLVSLKPNKNEVDSYYTYFLKSAFQELNADFKNKISEKIEDELFQVSSMLYIKYDTNLKIQRVYYSLQSENPDELDSFIKKIEVVNNKNNILSFIRENFVRENIHYYIYTQKENQKTIYVNYFE